MNVKERFDEFLAIGLERVYTDEECIALGALAVESESIATVKLPTPPMITHPLVDFWVALSRASGVANPNYGIASFNVKAIHKYIYNSILRVVNRK